MFGPRQARPMSGRQTRSTATMNPSTMHNTYESESRTFDTKAYGESATDYGNPYVMLNNHYPTQLNGQPQSSNNAFVTGDVTEGCEAKTWDTQVAQVAQVVDCGYFTTFNTAPDRDIPTTEILQYAKRGGETAYNQYHIEQGNTTSGQTDLEAHEALDVHNLPTSEELTRDPPAIQTYFPDALTAEFYRAACRPKKKQCDATIPQTAEALRGHARLLVRAFNNEVNTDDNPQMLKSFHNQHYDQKLVECLCWNILKHVIWRSESEEPLMTGWDMRKAKTSIGHDTFAERFDAVVRTMAASKTICKHLYDAPFVNVVVDDPTKASNRVKSNRELNKLKGEQMREGKRAREEQAESSGTPAPGTGKRRRSARTCRQTTAPVTPKREINGYNPVFSNSPTSEFMPTPPSGFSTPASMPRRSMRHANQLYATPTNMFDSPLSMGFDADSSDPLVKAETSSGAPTMGNNLHLPGPSFAYNYPITSAYAPMPSAPTYPNAGMDNMDRYVDLNGSSNVNNDGTQNFNMWPQARGPAPPGGRAPSTFIGQPVQSYMPMYSGGYGTGYEPAGHTNENTETEQGDKTA
jgi:hypothetical protein